jgi:putative beta-barrel porin BBP2
MAAKVAGPSGLGFWRTAIAGLFVAGLTGGRALAQEYKTIGTGVNWGRFDVFPSVAVDYGYDSNIFYSSQDLEGLSDVVTSRVLLVQPRVLFDMPMGQSWVRWAYLPVFRNYSTTAYVPTKQWSQTFDMDGHLRLGSRFYTTFRDRFVYGTQELSGVDPGGEVKFGDVPYRNNSPQVEVGCDLAARQGVSVVWNYNSVQFTGDDAVFYNYRGHALQARYNYRVSDATTSYVYAGEDNTQQVRPPPDNDTLDVETRSAGVGLNQVLNRAVTAAFSAGYQAINYVGGAASNYRGAVLSGNASWLLSEITRLSFQVRRQPYSSFFLNNNYYLNRVIGADITHQQGGAWYWRVGAGIENNTYSDPLDVTGFESSYCRTDSSNTLVCPSAGALRRDRALHLQAGVGGEVSRSARWFLGYTYESRSSNILQVDVSGFGDPFAYNVNRMFLRIEVGLL